MIKNNTPYIGKIKLKFEKYPHYTGSSFLNKIHLDLGFTKLVSRVLPNRTKSTGFEVDPKKVELINKFTGGRISDHKFGGDHDEEYTLYNSFLSQSGEYIGDIKVGWWYYENGLVVCDDYPSGVAEIWDDNNIIGYYGYTHRGGAKFKIGDRLFDEKYEPEEKDYPEWMWSGFIEKFNESYKKSDDFDKKHIYNEGVKSIIPFKLRGHKTIETLDEALTASINMSRYLS